MRGKLSSAIWILLMCWVMTACTKELSLEQGGPQVPSNTSEGNLEGAPGACANFGIIGAFGQGLPLDTAFNQVTVEVNFSKEGTWFIFTDTVNGMWFRGAGAVTNLGVTTLTLQGYGTPLNPGDYSFTADYKGARCSFVITVYQTAVANGADYFPITAGSWWTYLSNDPAAGPADTAYQLSTGIIGSIPGGNSYNLFTMTVPGFKDSSYYRKNGNDYFQFGDLDLTGLADGPVVAEWNFLKDNVAVGTQWLSAEQTAIVSSLPVKVRLQFEIVARNVPVLLDNKVYANTIKVKTTQQVQLAPPAWQDAVQFEAWYARGIGLINIAAPAPEYGYRVIKHSVN